jgi:signal transduction histidine kinase/CheY-like chemotaxis protein
MKRKRSPLLAYGVAVATTLLVLALKLMLEPFIDEESPFLLFFAAVWVTAWYGGLGPGLLATVLAAIISDYFFLPPYYQFFGYTSGQTIKLSLFMLEGGLISQLTLSLNSARRRAEASMREAQKNEQERIALLFREQKSREAAEAANRSKDLFLAMVSHELRTPLNAILGYSQLLAEGNYDPERTSRMLQSIERNAKVQAHLIEDLLDVSRIVSGKLRLDVRPIDPIPVIENAIDAVRPAAEAKAIGLKSNLDPATGLILGDPDRLQQVIWNLLSNAIKFTPEEGEVEISLERVLPHVQIRVSDTGTGIDPDFLPYLFERFSQADDGGKRSRSGLGLGLAIVRHVVELHGGTVHAESGGGKGSTFTVRLPVRAVQMKTFPTVETFIFGEEERAPSTTLEGLKVLVVDDEADARELLSVALSRRRASVRTAGSVGEALEALKREQPDILVSDLAMPGEDGYALIRQLRILEGDRGKIIPAVALTAYAGRDDRRRALSAGFQAHLAKPVEPAQLADMIAALARRAA